MSIKTRIGLGVAFTAVLLFGAYGPGSPLVSGPAKASTHTYTCQFGSPDGREAFYVEMDGKLLVCGDN